MPLAWVQVLGHPCTKDKPSLLHALEYEMSVEDVYNLIEYYEYENWRSFEEYKRNEEK